MAEKDGKLQRIVLTGNPVSDGAVVARAYIYEPWEPDVLPTCFEPEKKQEKLDAFRRAAKQAKAELTRLAENLGPDFGDQAKIFLAHRELLDDEELMLETELAITEAFLEPDAAVEKVFTSFTEMLSQVDDPLIAARAADLQDVKKRLQRIYQGREEQNLSKLENDVILVARDLMPSDTAGLDRRHVKGIITEAGGTNSHSAILARSFQIPAISGVVNAVRIIPQNTLLALDAVKGQAILRPRQEEIDACVRSQNILLSRRRAQAQYLGRPGATRDGISIDLGINIGSCKFEASENYYDFIGLFRTEFLYMEGLCLPTEEEQLTAYTKVLEQANGKAVTLRTLDIGGDKNLPYMDLPREDNPFLGNRALRLCLSRPDIFQTQLRAALRASHRGKLQLMFPMVGGMEDIYRAKACVRAAMEQLDAKGIPYNPHIRIGIMIEIPSIALMADLAAAEVDFASVGSNDLTQYVSAADRMNPAVGPYYQNYSPAMLRLLETVFSAFTAQDKPISVCGEMAGDPKAAVLLTGLGARKLSMNPASLAGVKAALARVSLKEAQDLARQCLGMRTQKEILEHLSAFTAEAEV